MLRSVTDNIGDSFIITTEDGRVIVIDGGHKNETDHFLDCLKSITGKKKPHIDAWFLSHAHEDHCEVFFEIVEKRSGELSFDTVYANFPDEAFYEGYDEWGVQNVKNFNRLLPRYADKAQRLSEGQILNIGKAKFTVLYVMNPAWKECNEASTIMRMDLGGTSVMFTGDAETKAGNYVVEKYGKTGILKCDYCKMSHHGQSGVDRNFYEAVSPEVCFWPTPAWVYNNTNGNLRTFETREWVKELGVKKEYKSFEGSVTIAMKPRIVLTTDAFESGYPAELAIERFAKAGFDGLDMGLDYQVDEGSPFLGDSYLDWAKMLRKKADELGIAYTHAHAPYEADSFDLAVRSIEVSAVLGANYLVIHPIAHNENGKAIRSRHKFLKINLEAYKKLISKAEECGVTIVAENLLWGAASKPKVIAEVVRRMNSGRFGWCFDTGHSFCTGRKFSELRDCAAAPLSLHIHDNDGNADQHLLPGKGKINWDEFISILGETGYIGDCVMESHSECLNSPDEERDKKLAEIVEKAREIKKKMEKLR